MFWSVAYYDGQLPLRFIDSDNDRLRDVEPDNVVWVDIVVPGRMPWGRDDVPYGMRLLGADVYYFDIHNRFNIDFGLVNDGEGRQDFTWTRDDGFVQVADRDAEPGDRLFGVTLPADDAREVGLIS